MTKILPLFSGSSGNCVYINCGGEEVLIDAGVSCKRIDTALRSIGTSLCNIKSILVTHEHSDHIKGIDVICRKYRIPVYINRKSAASFELPLDELYDGCAKIADPGDTLTFGGFETNLFATPHDSHGSCGYHFTFRDGSRFALATDLGHMTDEIRSYLLGCNSIMLESNHDIDMLKNGPYPFILKKRILSDYGHLSNDACAQLVPRLVETGTKKIVLSHLSRENNTPELAYKTSADALAEAGFTPNDVKLTVAMRSIID